MKANGPTYVLLNDGLAHHAAGAVASWSQDLPILLSSRRLTERRRLQDTRMPWDTRTHAVSDWTAANSHAAGVDKDTRFTLYPGVKPLLDDALCVTPEWEQKV